VKDVVNKRHPPKKAPIADADTLTRPDNVKPRRFTLEELLEGMTPDKKPRSEDDWPVGEELI